MLDAGGVTLANGGGVLADVTKMMSGCVKGAEVAVEPGRDVDAGMMVMGKSAAFSPTEGGTVS
jgi:hypothetical protein